MLVIEMVPREVAKTISQSLKIPVIGIGCGPDVDGQVLVSTDMWGTTRWPSSFFDPLGRCSKIANRLAAPIAKPSAWESTPAMKCAFISRRASGLDLGSISLRL